MVVCILWGMKDELLALVAGLDVAAVLQRLCGALRMRDCGNRGLAFYLWELQSRRLCMRVGYPDAVSLAAGELGIGRRRAQELIAAGRGLLELRGVDAAFREGAICWSKVRMLLRVATVETEGSWVEKAKAVGCRELAGLAKRAVPGEGPGDVDPAGGLPAVVFRVEVEMDAVAYEEWVMAKRKLQAELGTTLSDADGTVKGRVPVDGSIYRVAVDEERAHVRADDGEVGAAAEVVEAAVSDGAVPDGMRRRVLARDGHRCARCERKGSLQAHHVEWRSRGGETAMRNLVTLCSRCHALVHQGLLVVDGQVSDGLRFRAVDEITGPVGLSMSLRSQEPELPEPELTLDSIPDNVSLEWWRANQDRFIWSSKGIVGVRPPARARATAR